MQDNTPLLEGVRSKTVQTSRLRTHLLESGPEEGIPVLMIHGNVSSSRFFEETLAAFPQGFRGLAPDLRGFGDSEVAPVDATRGLRDFSDDLFALVESLGLQGTRLHLAGWSMGGAIALQYTMDHPQKVASITLIDPMSPYGFGGTKDEGGTPCWPDFAGSGGGTANPEFVRRLSEGDRTDEDANSPRNVMRQFYFKPPFEPEREEVYLSSMLSTATGEDNYPGDLTTSPNWPGLAPGRRGVNNAISPRYCNLSGFAGIEPKPPVLWVRGADDVIVSDESLLDFGTLGRLGAVPDWPGEEVYPPQPMVSQMRVLLENYAAVGGSFREEVIEDCGHSPHVEKPDVFRNLFFGFLS
ncbi:alpha/beta hydrolase [Rubrobacter calidifluminis]|uniref:alpha/beta hydrolase n=1 Tax=Rubrobacter calidifluminis TaxID=1392640 RepID=UPI002360B3FD|nr:alpha/beta hydrolase [Rubrobacter calidifluminis]